MSRNRIQLRTVESSSPLIVVDYIGDTWEVRLNTTFVDLDHFTDGTPAYRAVALSGDNLLAWWQPIDTRWW